MADINDGGPAFPGSVAGEADGSRITSSDMVDPGMSLRDWFAGQALTQSVEDYGQPKTDSSAGVRRDRGNPVTPYATKDIGSREDIIARQAYKYADAMLKARDRKHEKEGE